jgi:hypothetical protein
MAGLNLQTGYRVQSAAPPSAAGTTITQAAYGPASGAAISGGPSTAVIGTVGAGIAAIAILGWLWWTLPR